MRKANVLAIAPYEGLKEQLLQCAAKRTDLTLTVHIGDLERGAAIVESLEEAGFDAVISRGGTARLIAARTAMPVIGITSSVFDALRCIRLAQGCGGMFAVVAFENITAQVNKVLALVQQTAEVHAISDAEDARRVIEDLKRRGYTVIVGDAIATTVAESMQMTGLLITSGEESVMEALDRAIWLCQITGGQTEQNRIYSHLLTENGLAIAVLEESGKLLYTSVPPDDPLIAVIFRKLGAYAQAVLDEGEVHLVRKAKEYLWYIDGIRMEEGESRRAAFTIRRAPTPSSWDNDRVQCLHMLEGNAATHSSLDTIGRMSDVLSTAQSFTQATLPVCIRSQDASSASALALWMHNHGPWATHTMLMIDCNLFDEKAFLNLLEAENTPLSELGLGVCVQNAENLPPHLQQHYIFYAQNTLLHTRNRIYYLLSDRAEETSPICAFILQCGSLMLRYPSLNERREDLSSLCSLYLNRLNTELGRQITSFESAALEQILAFPWQGGYPQLWRVMRNLVLTATDGEITHAAVQRALSFERTPENQYAEPLWLEGTLEEITARAIRHVMALEHQNRSRAAKRLGISRSTLWRLLKSIPGQEEAGAETAGEAVSD